MEELGRNLQQTINRAKKCETEWQNDIKLIQMKMEALMFGTNEANTSQTQASASAAAAVIAASPQQMKKRPKRLSAVVDKDESDDSENISMKSISTEIEAVIVDRSVAPDKVKAGKIEVQQEPEPEPEHVFARPQRAAKLKADNFKEPPINSKMRRPDNPNETAKKIKKENETRASQLVSKKSSKSSNKSQVEGVEELSKVSIDSVASGKKVDDSLVVIPGKEAPTVELSEDEDVSSSSSVSSKKKSKKDQSKNPMVKVKKEKLSSSGVEDIEQMPPPAEVIAIQKPTEKVAPVAPVLKEEIASTEESLQTTTSTDTTSTTTTKSSKRTRKNKAFNHRPIAIKEERVSIVPEEPEEAIPTPVSTRTRSGSTTKPRPVSIYEDAVDKMPQGDVPDEDEIIPATPKQSIPKSASPPAVANETIATNNATMMTACDATFVTNQGNNTFAMPAPQSQATFNLGNNPNATVTLANETAKKPNGSLGDATFDVRTPPSNNDSIMTEDDSFDKPLVPTKKLQPRPPPPPQSAKVLKSKSKGNELFNPCVQSPVKKKVEAFEHHAQKSTNEMTLKTRSKKTKENSEPELPSMRELKANSMATTPVIGKPHAPVLGRFLTPTQQSNVTPNACNAKKLPNSASKIMQFPTSKLSSTGNLKTSSSTSSQSLSRENSEDDLKKGFNKLQQLADERKKKRELKHQQAALLREAKEKERAERLRKIVKEREEKNRKKAIELEQKKRELEEINRNLKLQEEREQKQKTPACKTKLDPAEVARQERELLEQMKMSKMKMPPPPKQRTKYNFNMLHSDDSTDDEGKSSYKRPSPPQWSKSSVRADFITCQSYASSEIIDSFFSVQPMTPDLKAIFPNIDPRYLKRNSSAIWRTPPRYSEMPKY